jgi:iron complex transport system substrate-binding protein
VIRYRLLAALAALLLVLAACSGGEDEATDAAAGAADDAAGPEADDEGGDADEEDEEDEEGDGTAGDGGAAEADDADLTGADDLEASDGAFPVTLSTLEGDLTVEARPERIVSMSPTATEMLFALGAGDQVVAADSYSTYPPEAPATELSAFEPSLEAIAANEPDLLILGAPSPEVQQGMADIGVPVLTLPSAGVLEDSFEQIAQLGIATGNIDGAAELNASMQTEIVAILAEVPAQADREPVRVYHELDETFFSASSASFIGDLYTKLGYENIADAADPDGTGYPQLQVEQIVEADPTLIVITDAYGYGPDEVAARPGWETLTAVQEGNVVQVDADIASRWGPRVVELLRSIVEAAAVPAGG